MNLITSKPVGEGVSLSYFLPGNEEIFEYVVSRTVISVSFPNDFVEKQSVGMGYACVLGERVWKGKQGTTARLERMYMVLDEYEGVEDAELFDNIISLKDRYSAETVIIPKEPRMMVEQARRIEGIAYYHNRPDQESRSLWPTYVSRETVAAVRDEEVADSTTQRREIEALRAQIARDPNSGEAIVDSNFKEVPRFVIPEGFPTHRTASGLTAGIREVVQGVWLGLHFLERSVSRYFHEAPRRQEDRVGNPTTGY